MNKILRIFLLYLEQCGTHKSVWGGVKFPYGCPCVSVRASLNVSVCMYVCLCTCLSLVVMFKSLKLDTLIMMFVRGRVNG